MSLTLFGGPIQPPWVPADNGLLAASGDPATFTSTVLLTAGTPLLAKIQARVDLIVSNLIYSLTTPGAGASTGSFAACFDPTGARLGLSADAAAQLTGAAGPATIPMLNPFKLAAGSWMWAWIVANLAVTLPTLQRCSSASASSNLGLAASAARFATNGAGITAVPANIVPGNNAVTANGLLVGVT